MIVVRKYRYFACPMGHSENADVNAAFNVVLKSVIPGLDGQSVSSNGFTGNPGGATLVK